MPHFFQPLRPKKYALGVFGSDQFWEYLNAYTYLIGGFLFIIGSIFFLPKYDKFENVGSWIFFVASIFYLIVAMHDVAELSHSNDGHLPVNIDSAAALNYVVGSILFIFGSVFFLPHVGWTIPGAWCFIIGSICFALGAVLNGLQIFEAETKRDAQFLLMTAMWYIIGSVMFLVPSVPYLFTFETADDGDEIYTFLASIYICGSICFTAGGAIGFYRSIAFRQLERALGIKENIEETGEEEGKGTPALITSVLPVDGSTVQA